MLHLWGGYWSWIRLHKNPSSRILQNNRQSTEVGQPDLGFQYRIEAGTKADHSNRWSSSGGKSSLKFLMLRCAEEAKLGDRKTSSFGRLITSHKVGDNKPFKSSMICNHYRLYTPKIPRPAKPSNLISTFFWPLASRKCELLPRRRRRVVHAPDIVTASVDRKENLDSVLKDAPQVWLASESPPSQGVFPLTHVVCPQSTGGQQ